MKCFDVVRYPRVLAAALFVIFASSVPASAATLTFDFSGSGGSGAVGASRTFTTGGVTVTATAWSYGINFQESSLGQWSAGLGVCNTAELSIGCPSGYHQVDNEGGTRDYILFQFASAFLMDPTDIYIETTDSSDLDVSYWTGNFVNPGDRLDNDLYSTLASRGFGSEMFGEYNGNGDTRTVALTSGNVTALLFGSASNSSNDAFKIDKLTINTSTPPVVTPEPGSLFLLGTGLMAVGKRVRRRWAA